MSPSPWSLSSLKEDGEKFRLRIICRGEVFSLVKGELWMKVILKQDVKSLGKKDSIVEVNDGYARNFLLPKGLALEANNTNMNMLSNKKESEKLKKEKELKAAKEQAEMLKDGVIILKVKAGENGKLFGSVTSKDVSDKIKTETKLDIDKKKIVMPDSVKALGTYTVKINLYPRVSQEISLKIEQE